MVDRFVGALTPVFRSSRVDVDLHYNPPGIRGEPRYLEGVTAAPSLKTILGITKVRRRTKKELGITDAWKPFRAWTNAKRRFKRKIGYESETGRLIRNGLPRSGGCSALVVGAMMARRRRWRRLLGNCR